MLRFRTHPIQLADALAHCRLDAFHHIERAGFELGRKHLANVYLPERLSQTVVRVLNAAAPAGLQLFRAPQILAVKLEVFLYEFGGQKRRVLIHHMKSEVILPIRNRLAAQLGIHLLHEIRRAHINHFKFRIPQLLVIHCPIKIRRQLSQFRGAHLVLQVIRISPFHLRPRSLRQPGFHAHDGCRFLPR